MAADDIGHVDAVVLEGAGASVRGPSRGRGTVFDLSVLSLLRPLPDRAGFLVGADAGFGAGERAGSLGGSSGQARG
jgi:hypothetical protein